MIMDTKVADRRTRKLDRIMPLIMSATERTAPVTMILGQDSLIITNCPPVILTDLIKEASAGEGAPLQPHDLSIHGGGLYISL